MNIGFIGAGKVGFSLGRYFMEHGFFVSGYYSQNGESAKEAARFTHSKTYDTVEALVSDCNLIFITVPDGAIMEVWEIIKHFPIDGKLICHCSGALSGAVFDGIHLYKAFGASIHPFFAVSNKYESYKELSQAFFTLEGDIECVDKLTHLLEVCGNAYQIIDSCEKVRYHAAGAIASNLMAGLISMAEEQLKLCGFTEEAAREALTPIVLSNVRNVLDKGAVSALTGPLERGDTQTVLKHLSVLEGDELNVYRSLSKYLVRIASKKNPNRDYRKMEEIIYEEHSNNLAETETGRK